LHNLRRDLEQVVIAQLRNDVCAQMGFCRPRCAALQVDRTVGPLLLGKFRERQTDSRRQLLSSLILLVQVRLKIDLEALSFPNDGLNWKLDENGKQLQIVTA